MKNYQRFKLFFMFMLIIHWFTFSIAYSQSPVPDVKINNLDEHLRFIPSEQKLIVSVQLDPGDSTENADWFLAASTPLGFFFYTQKGWTDFTSPVVQAPLQPLSKIELMNFPTLLLPAGDYVFYFAVDTEMDGAITWNQMDVDAVEFTILESTLPQVSRFIDSSSGGTLNVTNTRGDVIILTIPPFGLKESTEITLTALDDTVASPFTSNLFPGVVLSPQGLILEKPARLTVNFANQLTEPISSALFLVKGPEMALPLAERAYSVYKLEGDIFHFSTIDGAYPTEREILQAIKAVEMYYVFSTNRIVGEHTWHDTYATVKSLIEFSNFANGVGFEKAEEQAWKAAQLITSQECATHLAKPVPEEPCGKYKTIFNNLIDLSERLGLEECKNKSHYFSFWEVQERFLSLGNQCDNRQIEGIWHFTPSSINEQCTYFDVVIDEELGFPIRDIEISVPRSWDSNFIEASIVKATSSTSILPVMKDLVMKGSWNGDTGKFNLSVDTSEISICGELYGIYYDTLCEDVINCSLKSCNINLRLGGKASDPKVTSLQGDAYWSYSVTTEIGEVDYYGSRRQVPWTCEGSAFVQGTRLR